MKIKMFAALLVFLGGLAACTCGHAEDTKPKDIVDTAVAAGNFKTLAAALKAAGLVDTLKSAISLD